jgi:mannose-6-phosphate isomerase-like protein (cupin superfamily)
MVAEEVPLMPTIRTCRALLCLALVLAWVLAHKSAASARANEQAAATPQTADPPCPGRTMPSVQATGVYTMKPVAEIPINGQPAPGAIWQPGMRSYWHCHAGGQIMMVFEGTGRVQRRGERIRVLHKGETEYAGPGVEHWHGGAPDASAHFFQASISPAGVYWMEEVSRDDYMGNDNGIASRNEFLRTGVMKKPD